MERGHCRAVSPARKMVVELLRHAQKTPSLATGRRTQIEKVVAARNQLERPPSWLAILIRAYGLCGLAHPELRTAFIPYPWPRFYVHPETMCTIPVEREWQGEKVVLLGKIRGPENQSLAAIHGHLRNFQEAPVLEVSDFRQFLRLGKYPGWLRRFFFWQTLYWSGFCRARRFGTCNVSSLGKYQADQFHPLTPLTSYLSAGPAEEDGSVYLKIIYDHRVLDDAPVARCLISLEEILNTRIVEELRELDVAGRLNVTVRHEAWRQGTMAQDEKNHA